MQLLFLTCWQDCSPVAYLALGFKRQKRAPITIIDWDSVEPIYFRQLLKNLTGNFPDIPVTILTNACTGAEKNDLLESGFCEVGDKGTPASGTTKFNPGVLVAPAAFDTPVRSLVKGGFELLKFKGIESDGA